MNSPGEVPHRPDCAWLKDKAQRTVQIFDGAKALREATAPPAEALDLAKWVFGVRDVDRSSLSTGVVHRAPRGPGIKDSYKTLGSDKRKLCTLLEKSGLLSLHGDRTLAGEIDALRFELERTQVAGLPSGVTTSDLFLLCPKDPQDAAKTRLEQLRSLWRRGFSPIVHLLVVATDIKPQPDGRLHVHTLSASGKRSELDLPPTVHVWAGNTGDARAPFVVFIRMALGEDGEAHVMSGYAHPIMSQRQLTLVDSDRERITPRLCLRWHAQLPASAAPRVRLQKVAFTWRVGGRNISVDFVAYLVDDSGGTRRILFAVETRGSTDEDYVERKLLAKKVLEENGIQVVTDGPRPELRIRHLPTLAQQMEAAVTGALFRHARSSVGSTDRLDVLGA